LSSAFGVAGGTFIMSHHSRHEHAGEGRKPAALPSRQSAGGLFLLAVGLFALWQSSGLTTGTLRQIGPGMAPQALSVLVAICGIAMMVGAAIRRGETLERWTLRGPLFILGAAIAFGLIVKPFGLVVAAPVAITVGSLASAQVRILPIAVFSVVMTAFCLALFRFILALPIPVAPWLLGY
jgi:putative tricarboxylic transport membrane protein